MVSDYFLLQQSKKSTIFKRHLNDIKHEQANFCNLFSRFLRVFLLYIFGIIFNKVKWSLKGKEFDLCKLKTGYLKRSQRYELAILRPFPAIFPQTTLSNFTKVRF